MPGRSFIEQLESKPDMLLPEYQAGLGEPDAEGRRRWIDEAVAKEIFYADCDDGDAHAAFARLRPQSARPYVDAWPLDEFPSAARTYIVCDDDRIANPDWARGVARNRLDAELVELPGSHSPFLSRPGELADILHQRGAR